MNAAYIAPVELSTTPIPVAKRSERVCGCSLAGIVGSDPYWGMDISAFECFVLSGRGLCVAPIIRPEESYRL
jgi:hypothetical protein